MEGTKEDLVLENVWKKNDPVLHKAVMELWQRNFPAIPEHIFRERLGQLVFVVRKNSGEVVGIATAFKAHIEQLKNYLYSYRCFIDPAHRVPGLASKLIVSTRDWLESVYKSDGPENERCIGMITLVENDRIMKHRNEAVWPASKMMYIGNSPQGKHMRVYYFDKVLI